jgi:hypothetical protein
MTHRTKPQIDRSSGREDTARRLVELAISGLPPMFDREKQLFCYRLKKTEWGLVKEGISRRYTIITLFGLHRLKESGGISPIETDSVLQGLLANLEWVDNIGDLGLLLWLCALMAPERLAEVNSLVGIEGALSRYRDAKQGQTMEVAWFLTGLCQWGLARPEKLAELRSLSFETYRMLMSNYGGHGIFGHVGTKRSVIGKFRGRIGSFADQVYPIGALTKFYRAYQEPAALRRALECANTLCEAQGPLGQWWWHYDSSNGRIIEGYPVFSVHQHAMGPMTLFELGEATGHDFTVSIYKGLQWINSRNELAFDMEDSSADVVWRCMLPSSLKRYWEAAFDLGTKYQEHQYPSRLKVLFECRPYELGWLLYAFAGRVEMGAAESTAASLATIADSNTSSSDWRI